MLNAVVNSLGHETMERNPFRFNHKAERKHPENERVPELPNGNTSRLKLREGDFDQRTIFTNGSIRKTISHGAARNYAQIHHPEHTTRGA